MIAGKQPEKRGIPGSENDKVIVQHSTIQKSRSEKDSTE